MSGPRACQVTVRLRARSPDKLQTKLKFLTSLSVLCDCRSPCMCVDFLEILLIARMSEGNKSEWNVTATKSLPIGVN